MKSSRSKGNRTLELIRNEISPYRGRLAGSLRDALGVILALTISLTLRVPGISLALALLFLMQRERPGLTLRVGIQIFAGAVLAGAASLFWVQITDSTEVMRFLGVVIGVFIAAFCMVATTIPLFWTIFGFYGFLDLSSWDAHRTQDAIVTSTLYNIASLGLVVLCAVAVEYIFGTKHPAEELEQEINRRLTALSLFFRALAYQQFNPYNQQLRSRHHTLLQYAHAGDIYLNELYDRLRGLSQFGSKTPLGIHYRIGLLTRVLNKSVLLGFPASRQLVEEHQTACLTIAEACEALLNPAEHPKLGSLEPHSPALLREIFLELQQYRSTLQDTDVPSKASPPTLQVTRAFRHFLSDAFSSPNAVLYALKLTLAATICYILYNAFAWPGIVTCVVTVLFTGLNSTGAMRQKQLYRFSGAAIGGALGIATVSLLYPNMDSITSLIIVVAPIAFLSGWILRSPRMGYVGVQIGFAFFLTALPGFSAATQIAPARDRVIGVALGILVMWFIFDQLWPSRTSDALSGILTRIQKATEELHKIQLHPEKQNSVPSFEQLRNTVSMELANMQQLDFATRFESGRHRKQEFIRSRRLVREIESSSEQFYSMALQRPNS